MRTLFSIATMAGLTFGLVAGGFASEKPAKPAAKAPAKTAAKKCLACGMMMSTKKTKATPQAIKIGKTTYYCCAACDMGKKDKPHEGHGEKSPS